MVADEIQRWFERGAVDGFIIGATGRGKEEVIEFVDEVLPILKSRGLFRTDYEHGTLRGHVGLEFPVNRYS